MFDRWRRRKNVAQAENYIRATDNVSRPVAVLLSLAAIIIVAAIIFGLFLGGRWVYNTIRDNDEPTTGQTDTGGDDEQVELPGFVEEGDQGSEQGTGVQPSSPDQSTDVPNTGPAVIPDTGPGAIE